MALKKRQIPQNPFFPVNLLDLLIRHSSASHKRETIPLPPKPITPDPFS